MSFKGTLSAVPVAELLEWAQASAKTGALELENERFRKVAYFVDGSIVAIDSTEPADSISHRLHVAGHLSEEQAAAARRVAERTGRTFADVLHRTGAIDGNDLEQALEEQSREAVLAIFLWSDGRFCLREEALPQGVPAAVSLDPLALVEEGGRRRARAREIREKLGNESGRFRLAVDPIGAAPAGALEETMVRLLLRPQTVLSLMLEATASEFAVLEVLAGLDARAALIVDGAAPSSLTMAAVGVGQSSAEAGGTSGHRDSSSMASMAVGILDTPAARETPVPRGSNREPGSALPGLGSAVDLLGAARGEMERRNYRRALELFRMAELIEPGDSRLASLRAAAESVYCETAYRTQFPPDSRPVRVAGSEPLAPASALARLMVENMDGRATVRDLVLGSGGNEADALHVLTQLRQSGAIEILQD